MTAEKLSPAQLTRIQKALGTVPFAQLIGLELEETGHGTATMAFTVRKKLMQGQGRVHGGAIASLIDSATAFAILSLLEPKERVTTVDLTISYLRPVTGGRLRAVAKVVRSGRRLFVVTAEVFTDDGNLASTALSTYIRL